MAFASHYGARILIVHAFELTQAAMEAELLGHAQSISRKDRQSRLEAVAAKALPGRDRAGARQLFDPSSPQWRKGRYRRISHGRQWQSIGPIRA